MIDVHCHILPGVDDGAPNREIALEMLDAARAAGVTRMVATPHVYAAGDIPSAIPQAFEWLREAASRRGMEAFLGYEVSYRVLPDADQAALDALCVAGSRCLLLELPAEVPFPGWMEWMEKLARRYDLVIAHPERYRYMQTDRSLARTLCAMGCELQVGAGALQAAPLSPWRRAAVRLVGERLARYIASDAHGPRDYPALARAWRRHDLPPGKLARLGRGEPSGYLNEI